MKNIEKLNLTVEHGSKALSSDFNSVTAKVDEIIDEVNYIGIGAELVFNNYLVPILCRYQTWGDLSDNDEGTNIYNNNEEHISNGVIAKIGDTEIPIERATVTVTGHEDTETDEAIESAVYEDGNVLISITKGTLDLSESVEVKVDAFIMVGEDEEPVSGTFQLVANYEGADGGDGEGVSVLTSFVFKRQVGKPSTPAGGSFSDPVPFGWSDSVPDGVDPIWMSRRVFYSDNSVITGWDEPRLMADSTDFNVIYSTKEAPQTPPSNGQLFEDVAEDYPDWKDEPEEGDDIIWMATSTRSMGVWSDYKAVRIKGEDGESPVFADLDNEMDSIVTSEDGTIKSPIILTTNVYMWYGISEMVCSLRETKTYSGITISASDYDTTNKRLPITITIGTSYAVNRTEIELPIVGTYGGVQYIRNLTFTVVSVKGGGIGENAVVYSLNPSTSSIKRSKLNVNTPSVMTCGVVKTDGQVNTALSSLPSGFTMTVKVDNGIEESYDIGAALGVSTTTSSVVFCLKLNGTAIDMETIPVVADGKDGQSKVTSYIFARSKSQPTGVPAVTCGSYSSPNPPADGWSGGGVTWYDGIPTGTATVWMCQRTFTSDGDNQDAAWRGPTLMADSDTMDVCYCASSEMTDEIRVALPIKGSNTDNDYWHNIGTESDYWQAVALKSAGVWGDWSIVKIKGEDGQPGNDGHDGNDGEDGQDGNDGDPYEGYEIQLTSPQIEIRDNAASNVGAYFYHVVGSERTPYSGYVVVAWYDGEGGTIGNTVQNGPVTHANIYGSVNANCIDVFLFDTLVNAASYRNSLRKSLEPTVTPLASTRILSVTDGKDGEDGEDAITAECSYNNGIVPITYNADGEPEVAVSMTYGFNIKMYKGAEQVDITSIGTITKTSTNGINAPTATIQSGDKAYVYAAVRTILGESTENRIQITIPVTCTIDSTSYTRNVVFTLTSVQQGTSVTGKQGLTGCIIRMRGEWSATSIYVNESTLLSGDVRYIDVVQYNNGTSVAYYQRNTTTAGYAAGTLPTNTNYWIQADYSQFIATKVLLSDNAVIDLLQGRKVWITNNEARDNIVAGMQSTVEGTGELQPIIFAGASNNNANQANFRVYSDGTVYCGNATIVGNVTSENANIKGKVQATSGSVGGFSIGSSVLTNSNGNASITINDTTNKQVTKIGRAATDPVNSRQVSMYAESDGNDGEYSTALYLKAFGASYNYAFHGSGNGVLNGLVFGYKTATVKLDKTQNKYTASTLLNNGSTIIITDSDGSNKVTSGHKFVKLPLLSDVRKALGMSDSDTTSFSIEITYINRCGSDYVYLQFRGYSANGTDDTGLPYLMTNDDTVRTGGDSVYQLGKGDVAKIMLVYNQGTNDYCAYDIIRRG